MTTKQQRGLRSIEAIKNHPKSNISIFLYTNNKFTSKQKEKRGSRTPPIISQNASQSSRDPARPRRPPGDPPSQCSPISFSITNSEHWHVPEPTFNIEFGTTGSVIGTFYLLLPSNRCRQEHWNRGRRCLAVGVFNNTNKWIRRAYGPGRVRS